ncbi:MAG: hypothetical protein QOJ29_1705 [Thermoleophilaceae bacterium]|nr:hypothetical protein [Thermoleophilaceae bacterium]
MIESEPADRSRRPRQAPTLGRGKNVGECARCGKPVSLEQNFTRFRGRVVHLRGPIGARTPASIPNVVEDAVARRPSREQ